MNGDSADWDNAALSRIVSLRLAVGLLGEREHAGWWASSFMSKASTAFLTPVFGVRILHARYQGVLEAARRVHDERIGVGRAFHPFRLPDVMEQKLFGACQAEDEQYTSIVGSADAAQTALVGLMGKPAEAKPGPTLMGTAALLDDPGWVADVASVYLSAFGAGVQSFPYFLGAQ